MEINLEKLRYPIGKFVCPAEITTSVILNWIEIIEEFPSKLKNQVEELSNADLQKTYRPNGWTIAQVINHCADSHMNSFIRFKLALTEDSPTIKPYFEDRWAELPDSNNYPIDDALKILESLHAKWVYLLRSLSEEALNKEFIHPESEERISLKRNIGIYAWHCEHHLAHVVNAKKILES